MKPKRRCTYFGYFTRFAHVQPHPSKGLCESSPLVWKCVYVGKLLKYSTHYPRFSFIPKTGEAFPKTALLFLLFITLLYVTPLHHVLHQTFVIIFFKVSTSLTIFEKETNVCNCYSPTIGGRVWDKYETTRPLPSYLVAFQVWSQPPKERVEGNLAVWTQADRNEDPSWVVVHANLLLNFLGQETGHGSDVAKLDIMGVPSHHFSAMENWGLYTFR